MMVASPGQGVVQTNKGGSNVWTRKMMSKRTENNTEHANI